MVQNQNMIITAALAIVIIIAIGAFAYTNLFSPDDTINDDTNNENTDDSTGDTEDDSEDTSDENTEDEILLTIIDNGVNYTYTLSDLEEIESVSGQGRKISSIGEISGPYNYTGVSIKSLLKDVNISNDSYQFSVIANDGYSKDFIMNESNIEVDVYDETGNISANGSATMIIAYKEEDQYYTGPDPLRIAFIGDKIPITSSGLWIKNVTTIEIIYLE